jgi:hypothetical protein
MPKTKQKKYKKKPRGYKRKLANAPQHVVYNRHEPPRIGYAYNRTLSHPDYTAFHLGNIRYQDREHLEALKRLKDRNGTQSRLMAENFKAIESAYYTGSRWKIGAELRGIKEQMSPSLKQRPAREVAKMTQEGPTLSVSATQRKSIGDTPGVSNFLAKLGVVSPDTPAQTTIGPQRSTTPLTPAQMAQGSKPTSTEAHSVSPFTPAQLRRIEESVPPLEYYRKELGLYQSPPGPSRPRMTPKTDRP